MAKRRKSKKNCGSFHYNSSENENNYQPQISDKQKAHNSLVYISLLYSKLKNRLITDAELQELCTDWDLAVFACGMFWASHIIVRLNGWEFQVARQWFADGANLETAPDWIDFDRIDGGRA